jgi:hypothetical protein
MAREYEAAAPLDFCLGVPPTILVFVKLKRGRPVLPRHGAWRGNVELPRPALWRGRFNPCGLLRILLIRFHDFLATAYARLFRPSCLVECRGLRIQSHTD